MEGLINNVDWLAVIIGAVVAYGVGWVWYSPSLFATKWMKGIGISPDDKTPMLPAMMTQAVGTFFLAWAIGVAMVVDMTALAILFVLTLATIVKANGAFSKKSVYAIAVESGYIIVMAAIMIMTHMVL